MRSATSCRLTSSRGPVSKRLDGLSIAIEEPPRIDCHQVRRTPVAIEPNTRALQASLGRSVLVARRRREVQDLADRLVRPRRSNVVVLIALAANASSLFDRGRRAGFIRFRRNNVRVVGQEYEQLVVPRRDP